MKKKDRGCAGFVRKVLFLVFLGLIIFQQRAEAEDSHFPPLIESPNIAASAIVAPVAVMHNMYGNRFVVEVSPAYFTDSFDGGSVSGYGGGLALKYEITSNWGAALLGSYGSTNEFSTTKSLWGQSFYGRNPNYQYFVSGKYKLDYSSAVAIALTYDPFSKPGGFRLPIFLGAAYSNAKSSGSETWMATNGKQVVLLFDNKVDEVVPMIGLSAEFNIWKFRFEPAVVALADPDYTLTQKDPITGTTSSKTYGGSTRIDGLLGIKYVPWGLAYNLQRDISDQGGNFTVHSLIFSKNW